MTSVLLQRGVNKNLLNKSGCSALHLAAAAETEDEAIVELLLENGANLNIIDKFGQTALHHSASRGLKCTNSI